MKMVQKYTKILKELGVNFGEIRSNFWRNLKILEKFYDNFGEIS